MSNPSTRCGKCGRTNRSGARFCVHCGADMATALTNVAATPISAPTVLAAVSIPERCPSCGQEITLGARFCRNCGKTIAVTSKPGANEDASSAPPSSPVVAAPSVVTETPARPPSNAALSPSSIPANSPTHPAPSIAAAPLPTTASRFAFPVWAWTLFGFFVGLLTGVGVLWAQPELLNWAPVLPQATVEPAPGGPSSNASAPGAMVAPSAVITSTHAPLTATVPATGSLSAKLPLTGTKPITATIRPITP